MHGELQVRNYQRWVLHSSSHLRGHGDSDWSPDGSYKIENFRDDLLSVIRQIGKPAALVGASLVE